MSKKQILFAIGCRVEDVYRASIEATSLAQHSMLELWDIGWLKQKLHAKNYTRFRSVPVALPRIVCLLLPEVIFILLQHRRLKAALMLLIACVALLPFVPLALLLKFRPRIFSSSASDENLNYKLGKKERFKMLLQRLRLYNHIKSVRFLFLILQHSLSHYDVWRYSKKSYDIINIKDADTLLFGALVKLCQGGRLIYNCYECFPYSMPQSPSWLSCLVLAYERSLVNIVDTIITVTPSMAAYLQHTLAFRQPIKWVPNVDSLPTAVQSSDSAGYAKAQSRMIFIYQGSFSPGRGLEELISAWKYVDSSRAVLFLRGPYSATTHICMKMAQELNLLNQSVFFLPAIISANKETLEESLAIIKGADVGLILYDVSCPNNLNASPRKLSHYLLAGKMIISTSMTFVGSIIQKAQCGIIIDTICPHKIAVAVNNCHQDSTMTAMHKENARKYARKSYHWDSFEKKYLNVVLGEVNF